MKQDEATLISDLSVRRMDFIDRVCEWTSNYYCI